MCKIQSQRRSLNLFITQNLPNQFPSFDCSSHHQERHLCHHHFFHCCVLFCMFDTVDVWDNSSCHMYLDQKIEGTTFIPGYNYIRIHECTCMYNQKFHRKKWKQNTIKQKNAEKTEHIHSKRTTLPTFSTFH